MKVGKRYKECVQAFDKTQTYEQKDALDIVVKNAKANDFGVMIAAAGMAAHLAGAVAAHTTLPVIGIPVSCKNTGGMDALLATVQMPTGMPVATVAIDGAANAALLAVQILALSEPELADKLVKARKEGEEKVLEKNKAIEEKFNK